VTVSTEFYVPDFQISVSGETFRFGSNVDVLSVTITETINQADTFQLTVREHNPKPERFAGSELRWLDSTVFDEGNKIDIELGYQGNRGIALSGQISGLNVSFPESGAPTLTVRGQSHYKKLQRRHRRKPFESKTDSGIAREIAADLGLDADVDETDVEHLLVSTQGKSYADFLQDRAQRLNYEVAVKGNTLIFKRPTYLVSARASLTLIWGENLRSFTPNTAPSNMPSRVDVRNTQTGQGGGKEALAGSTTAAQYTPRLGSTSGPERAQQRFGESVVLASDQRVTSQAEATAVSRAEMERRALGAVSGKGSCIGNPELVSRTVIELQRLGKRFSGLYYVTSTTHTINASGYTTEFDAKRDAL
jgi:phage protein D